MLNRMCLASAALALAATSASAHVVLEPGAAPVGSVYRAALTVPHGCEGKPTQSVRVRIPQGFHGAKPMAKAGWTLEKIVGPLDQPHVNHGVETTEGIVEIIWSGGSLPDDEFDEFVIRGRLADDLEAGSTLHFRVVQECEGGLAERWIEIPEDGQSVHDLKKPAPGLRLLERSGGH